MQRGWPRFGYDSIDAYAVVSCISRGWPRFAVDVFVRVLPDGVKQWMVVVTARLVDNGGLATTFIPVGQSLLVDAPYEMYHDDNAHRALELVRSYLESRGFVVAPGVLNPRVALENIVEASVGLWQFDGTTLVSAAAGTNNIVAVQATAACPERSRRVLAVTSQSADG